VQEDAGVRILNSIELLDTCSDAFRLGR